MSNFLSSALGNKGVAKMAGQKAGELVEDTVTKVMGGKGKNDEKKGGGLDAGNLLSFGGGKKEGDKGGFDAGDVLSLVGGKKEGDKGGFDVGDVLSFGDGGKQE